MAAYTTDKYTSRRQTRVYRREDSTTTLTKDDLIGQTQPIQPKKRLFDELSLPQIIAGAAAAATSVALSSYIGVAGSIIGAAISSVVTVVSSQLYRRFLDASARKIKDAGALAASNLTTSMHASGQGDDASATAVAPANGVRGARIAPSKLRARAAAERAATQKKVIVFSVLAAAVAVAACAAVILLGTAGEGIGEKTPTIIPQQEAVVEQEQTAPHAAQGTGTGADTGATGTDAPSSAGAGAHAGTTGTQGATTGGTATDGGATTDTGDGSDANASTGANGADNGTGADGADSTDSPSSTGDASSSQDQPSTSGDSPSSDAAGAAGSASGATTRTN